MHTHSFAPLCPFGSTEDEHLEVADPTDGSVFRVWSVNNDHTLFLRIYADGNGYASYHLGPAEVVLHDCLALLSRASPRQRRSTRRLLRRWGLHERLFQTSARPSTDASSRYARS